MDDGGDIGVTDFCEVLAHAWGAAEPDTGDHVVPLDAQAILVDLGHSLLAVPCPARASEQTQSKKVQQPELLYY